jgi:V-type H+-transporting ATPase subunit a
MSFYRSDTVNQYKFILPRESAWEIMNVLGSFFHNVGQTSLIHVIPTKILAVQKPFISQVKRCEESLQKIINLERILQEKMILNSF